MANTVPLMLGLLLGGALLGCAAQTPVAKPVPAAEGAISNREISAPIQTADNEWQEQSVVRVVGTVSCTGTLIADDLVLTAHHCVSKRNANGRVMAEDVTPESLSVELGSGDLPFAEVSVRSIVSPDCGYSQGNGDIAILVLSRPAVGMPIWAPRLDTPPVVGEDANTAGFGRCGGDSGDTVRYHRRPETNSGSQATAASKEDKVLAVSAGQIMAQASVCPGDSGGPVFNANSNKMPREIIGVISASVMDNDSNTLDTSYFTRLDVWPQLFSAAHEIAGGASPSELPPFRSCSAK